MNVIARLEFELAYYDSVAHRFKHYTTRTPPLEWEEALWHSPYIFLSWLFVCLLFKGISTFNAEFTLLEEYQWFYLTHKSEDIGVYTFPKGICPKVNVIAWLKFELAYYDSAVKCFNHYTTGTPPLAIELTLLIQLHFLCSFSPLLIPLIFSFFTSTSKFFLAHSARAVEYTNCISAEEKDPTHNECPEYTWYI